MVRREPISKVRIRVQGKARSAEIAQSRCKRDELKDFEAIHNAAMGT